MRKILSVLAILTLLSVSSFAFAGEEPWRQTAPRQKNLALAEKGQRFSQPVEYKTQLQAKKEQIKANRQEILELRKEARAKAVALQNRLNSLRKSHSLTPEKTSEVIAGIKQIKTDLNSLRNTIGSEKSEVLKFRESIKERNPATAETSLSAVISVQEQRITTLKSILSSLEKLENSL